MPSSNCLFGIRGPQRYRRPNAGGLQELPSGLILFHFAFLSYPVIKSIQALSFPKTSRPCISFGSVSGGKTPLSSNKLPSQVVCQTGKHPRMPKQSEWNNRSETEKLPLTIRISPISIRVRIPGT